MGPGEPGPSRARRRAVALTTVVACGLAVFATSAQAVPGKPDPGRSKQRADAQVARLQDQVADTSSDLSAAYAALRSTQARLPAARTVLEKARAAADAADRANAAAAQELEVAQANEAKAQAELATTTKAVAASRVRVAQFAAQIYQEQGFGELDVALSSSDPQQFADRLALVGTVMDVQDSTMQRLATEQAGLTALEDHLSALRADSAAKKEQAEVALDRAEDARAAAERARADLETLAASQQTQATTLQGRLAAERTALAQMEAEQARLKAVLAKIAAENKRRAAAAAAAARKAEAARRAAGRSSGGSRGSSSGGEESGGFLSRPMSGRVSSEYGMRMHPILGYRRLHSGRDFAAPCGTPVRAAAPGRVIDAGWGGAYGNRVVIDHGMVSGESLATTYNHMRSIRVRGGSVQRGEIIGYEGSTGRSTGCHLHFEALENGEFADPRRWM